MFYFLQMTLTCIYPSWFSALQAVCRGQTMSRTHAHFFYRTGFVKIYLMIKLHITQKRNAWKDEAGGGTWISLIISIQIRVFFLRDGRRYKINASLLLCGTKFYEFCGCGRECNAYVAGAGGIGQKFGGSGMKKIVPLGLHDMRKTRDMRYWWLILR